MLFSGQLDAKKLSTSVKFLDDVVPLTDLKINPGRVVKHAVDAHRPVPLTSRGRGAAVVQSVSDYEKAEEERAFMRAVVEGLADLEEGREVSLADAKSRFGLKWGMAVAGISFAEIFERVEVLAGHPDIGRSFRSSASPSCAS